MIFFALGVILILIYTGPSLWRNRITYPNLEKERTELWEKYKKPPEIIPLLSFKGVIHSHTYWSHDSRGTLPEILDAAKKAKLEYIFNADHKRHQLDSFPRGYHGVYDGIIIESGTEHSSGLMVSTFDSSVIDWSRPEKEIINHVVQNGGLAVYVHTEEHHDWENPDYQAMEIYNIHTDLLDEDGILPFVINNTVNGRKYMHWGFRELYDEQTQILNLWDRLNEKRRIVGIGAVDAHNNQGIRAKYHTNGMVEWVGPNADTLVYRNPTWLDKLLLGSPDKFGWSFKWEMDPYFNSFNFVNNHVFCDTFSNVSIKDHITKGHLYVSFESLAEARGFQFYAVNPSGHISAILGDSVSAEDVSSLKAVAPLPVKFELLKNGEIVTVTENKYDFSHKVERAAGNYRLVARLWLDKKWIPWVYTNPIYIY
ncbi:MAG: hypothetical protein MI975_13435 [Cytophagales bacterium]|nr:hypothetical protein [Cytophagales bacterium]